MPVRKFQNASEREVGAATAKVMFHNHGDKHQNRLCGCQHFSWPFFWLPAMPSLNTTCRAYLEPFTSVYFKKLMTEVCPQVRTAHLCSTGQKANAGGCQCDHCTARAFCPMLIKPSFKRSTCQNLFFKGQPFNKKKTFNTCTRNSFPNKSAGTFFFVLMSNCIQQKLVFFSFNIP